MWPAVQIDQLAAAACVRVQLQNTEDESRGTTETCTARSNERSHKERSCTHLMLSEIRILYTAALIECVLCTFESSLSR